MVIIQKSTSARKRLVLILLGIVVLAGIGVLTYYVATGQLKFFAGSLTATSVLEEDEAMAKGNLDFQATPTATMWVNNPYNVNNYETSIPMDQAFGFYGEKNAIDKNSDTNFLGLQMNVDNSKKSFLGPMTGYSIKIQNLDPNGKPYNIIYKISYDVNTSALINGWAKGCVTLMKDQAIDPNTRNKAYAIGYNQCIVDNNNPGVAQLTHTNATTSEYSYRNNWQTVSATFGPWGSRAKYWFDQDTKYIRLSAQVDCKGNCLASAPMSGYAQFDNFKIEVLSMDIDTATSIGNLDFKDPYTQNYWNIPRLETADNTGKTWAADNKVTSDYISVTEPKNGNVRSPDLGPQTEYYIETGNTAATKYIYDFSGDINTDGLTDPNAYAYFRIDYYNANAIPTPAPSPAEAKQAQFPKDGPLVYAAPAVQWTPATPFATPAPTQAPGYEFPRPVTPVASYYTDKIQTGKSNGFSTVTATLGNAYSEAVKTFTGTAANWAAVKYFKISVQTDNTLGTALFKNISLKKLEYTVDEINDKGNLNFNNVKTSGTVNQAVLWNSQKGNIVTDTATSGGYKVLFPSSKGNGVATLTGPETYYWIAINNDPNVLYDVAYDAIVQQHPCGFPTGCENKTPNTLELVVQQFKADLSPIASSDIVLSTKRTTLGRELFRIGGFNSNYIKPTSGSLSGGPFADFTLNADTQFIKLSSKWLNYYISNSPGTASTAFMDNISIERTFLTVADLNGIDNPGNIDFVNGTRHWKLGSKDNVSLKDLYVAPRTAVNIGPNSKYMIKLDPITNSVVNVYKAYIRLGGNKDVSGNFSGTVSARLVFYKFNSIYNPKTDTTNSNFPYTQVSSPIEIGSRTDAGDLTLYPVVFDTNQIGDAQYAQIQTSFYKSGATTQGTAVFSDFEINPKTPPCKVVGCVQTETETPTDTLTETVTQTPTQCTGANCTTDTYTPTTTPTPCSGASCPTDTVTPTVTQTPTPCTGVNCPTSTVTPTVTPTIVPCPDMIAGCQVIIDGKKFWQVNLRGNLKLLGAISSNFNKPNIPFLTTKDAQGNLLPTPILSGDIQGTVSNLSYFVADKKINLLDMGTLSSNFGPTGLYNTVLILIP